MDDDQEEHEMKSRPVINEILKKLVSCSEEEPPLKKTVHVYDAKELQSGWQPVSCSAKYVACPRKGNSPAIVKNESPKQKQNGNKDSKNDPRKDEILEKYNKYESVGVLSYDVSSWRTIVDPDTHTYIKRSHPCTTTINSNYTCQYGVNEAGIGRKGERVQFLDPGGALDKHLGDFVKRQRASSALVVSQSRTVPTTCYDQVSNTTKEIGVTQKCLNHSSLLHPIKEEICIQKRPVSEFRLKSLGASAPKLGSISPPIGLKPGILLDKGPHTKPRELSPLVFSKTKGEQQQQQQQTKTISVQGFPPGSQLRQYHKPSTPPCFQITNHLKPAKDKKLDWLPITSTTPYIQRNCPDGIAWPHTLGLPQNPMEQTICQLKSKERKPKPFTVASQLRPSIPCQMLELPLQPSAASI